MSETKKELTQDMPQAMNLVAEALKNPELKVEILDRIVDLQIKMMNHQAKMNYAASLTKFNSMKQTIAHNRKGKTAGSATFTYSDYPALVATISPWLVDCGLSFSHHQDPPMISEKGEMICVMVYCTVTHISGHSEEVQFPAMPDDRLKGKVSPSQLIQMAITYAKRQTLAMCLGLATAEDKNDVDSAPPEDLITEEQAANIQALIDETGEAGKKALLGWLKIDTIAEIPASKYDQAVAGLERRRKA